MRNIALNKVEMKAEKISLDARREKNERGVVRPHAGTLDRDRKLRKIATSGVVALFNAIATHQHSEGAQVDTAVKRTAKEKGRLFSSFQYHSLIN